MEIYFIIAVLAIVQSLFGFGMMIFGTPTLLLLGYSFPETSAALYPAALPISLLQNFLGAKVSRNAIIVVGKWCLAPLAVTFVAVLSSDALQADLTLPIAFILSFFAVLRSSPVLTEKVEQWVFKHSRLWLLFTGVVQGFSNLGMGLAAILASASHKGKDDIRAFVALIYTSFAGLQLVILGTTSPELFHWQHAFYAVIAGAIYLTIGQFMFARITTSVFHKLFTVIIASYALLLIAKFFHVI